MVSEHGVNRSYVTGNKIRRVFHKFLVLELLYEGCLIMSENLAKLFFNIVFCFVSFYRGAQVSLYL